MRKLREKRGAALVSAITFMLVMIVLGIWLTSAISYSHLQLKTNQAVEKAWLDKESIGEYFVQRVNDSADGVEFINAVGANTKYQAEVEILQTEKSVTLRNARGGAVLYIHATKADESAPWKVVAWRYSEPLSEN